MDIDILEEPVVTRPRRVGRPANPPAGVLVLEDHPLMASSIRARLAAVASEEGWPVAITLAGSLRRARDILTAGWRPRLIVADLNLPDSTGLATLHGLREVSQAPILVFSGLEEPGAAREALEQGASQVISKMSVPAQFLGAARDLLGLPARAHARPASPTQLVNELTERQRDVLAQVAQGRTNREVAAALNIQVSTVHTHLSTVMQVLGATNRTQVSMAYMRWAQEGRDGVA